MQGMRYIIYIIYARGYNILYDIIYIYIYYDLTQIRIREIFAKKGKGGRARGAERGGGVRRGGGERKRGRGEGWRR